MARAKNLEIVWQCVNCGEEESVPENEDGSRCKSCGGTARETAKLFLRS